MDNELVVQESGAVVVQQPGELSVQQVLGQLAKIQGLMKQAMVKDTDYGTIPGTPKPTLYKPGAEKLCLMFRLDPEYEIVKDVQDGEHLSIVSRCILFHIATGTRMGSGMGSCSTRESRYAYRNAQRACPECDAEAIMKSKPPKRGYYCWSKKGGCGAQFQDGDARIENQDMGRVDNPDLPDQWNTCLKMSNKRALVAAVLNVTGASQIFTQDVEDFQRKAATASAPVSAPGPDKRQDPGDRATKQQAQALVRAAKNKLGDKDAIEWLRSETKAMNCTGETMTVAQYQELTRRLTEFGAPATSTTEAVEPLDDEGIGERFDSAMGDLEDA